MTGGAAASSALVACGSSPAAPPPAPATWASLVAGRPFYVAHRGGGGDWPEMTAYAYEQAAALPGLQALEVSLCLSADGVLVCSHDPTTTRTTGVAWTIAEQPWSTLSTLLVRPDGTVDPEQPARPLSRFEDVGPHARTHVLFAEPKVMPATQPLLAALSALEQPERVVWKSYVSSTAFSEAKARGFATWGYVLDQPSHLGDNLERYAASADVDMLGIALTESDALISTVVAAGARHGKQTMAYPLSTLEQRERALRLGCAGLMTSRIRELLP